MTSDLPAINTINKNDVHKKGLQTDNTEIAPPPEVKASHCSKPFLVTTKKKIFRNELSPQSMISKVAL